MRTNSLYGRIWNSLAYQKKEYMTFENIYQLGINVIGILGLLCVLIIVLNLVKVMIDETIDSFRKSEKSKNDTDNEIVDETNLKKVDNDLYIWFDKTQAYESKPMTSRQAIKELKKIQ